MTSWYLCDHNNTKALTFVGLYVAKAALATQPACRRVIRTSMGRSALLHPSCSFIWVMLWLAAGSPGTTPEESINPLGISFHCQQKTSHRVEAASMAHTLVRDVTRSAGLSAARPLSCPLFPPRPPATRQKKKAYRQQVCPTHNWCLRLDANTGKVKRVQAFCCNVDFSIYDKQASKQRKKTQEIMEMNYSSLSITMLI